MFKRAKVKEELVGMEFAGLYSLQCKIKNSVRGQGLADVTVAAYSHDFRTGYGAAERTVVVELQYRSGNHREHEHYLFSLWTTYNNDGFVSHCKVTAFKRLWYQG